MTLEAIDHVQLAIPAGGEDAARAFYVGVLGLVEQPKPPELAKRGGCWFEGAVKVHCGVEEPFRPARKAHIAFWVNDVGGWAGEGGGARGRRGWRSARPRAGVRIRSVRQPAGVFEGDHSVILLPLREKVARAAGRMMGRADPSASLEKTLSGRVPRDPSSVSSADTFSRRGRRKGK